MDLLSDEINVLLPNETPGGVPQVWLVLCEEQGLLGIIDGVCVSEEDAHLLCLDLSSDNPTIRYWIQLVNLTGLALEVSPHA